ncbi:MAG: hypothetical protein GY814_01235 [Gammaproteobacteria bacterium]|nr:hypothetical protein [Gammaproteobacteria bacterium]
MTAENAIRTAGFLRWGALCFLYPIDIRVNSDRAALEQTWDEFTFSHHFSCYDDIFKSYLFDFPRRSCDAFAMATLMCAPWDSNPYPPNLSLHELQEWIKPLIEEEHTGKFSSRTCDELRKKTA